MLRGAVFITDTILPITNTLVRNIIFLQVLDGVFSFGGKLYNRAFSICKPEVINFPVKKRRRKITEMSLRICVTTRYNALLFRSFSTSE